MAKWVNDILKLNKIQQNSLNNSHPVKELGNPWSFWLQILPCVQIRSSSLMINLFKKHLTPLCVEDLTVFLKEAKSREDSPE